MKCSLRRCVTETFLGKANTGFLASQCEGEGGHLQNDPRALRFAADCHYIFLSPHHCLRRSDLDLINPRLPVSVLPTLTDEDNIIGLARLLEPVFPSSLLYSKDTSSD